MNANSLINTSSGTIAIIGGGLSGSLVATHLLKTATQPLKIKLIERNQSIGTGIAYGTDDIGHLLNVSAGNMSAFPHDPGHLLRWLQHNRNTLSQLFPEVVNPSTFIPRKVYGLYIQSILAEAEATAQGNVQLERVIDEAIEITSSEDQASITLRGGQTFRADKVVLALGNAPFSSPYQSQTLTDDDYSRHAWSADALKDLDRDASVLIIGTGLTMVDMIVSLYERQHQGKIYAVSRRGLLPQSHRACQPYPGFLTPDVAPKTARQLFHRVRGEVKSAVALGYDWRAVIDCLRPITQQLWQTLSKSEQKRFLRHIAPYWDVHRHRIAPAVAEILNELLASGQLTVSAGRIRGSQPSSESVEVTIEPRGLKKEVCLQVRRIVNCTGVSADYRRTDYPLIAGLRSRGLISPNSLGLGLDTAPNGELLLADGSPSRLFYTLGTARKGDLWETIAVPEIRGQAQSLAETVLQSLPLYLRSIPAILPDYVTNKEGAINPTLAQSSWLFRQLFDPETSSYTYLIADKQTGDAVLVDSVLEKVERDLQILNELGLKLQYCLETHVHADHITGAGKLRQQTGCHIVVPQNQAVTKADLSLTGGEVLEIGSVKIEAIPTPGHTSGHISYLVNKTHLLTGDALLIRGCGRTDFQDGDPGVLYDSVTQSLFTLPDETLVYPAHDYQGRTVSSIGEEKRFNTRFSDGEGTFGLRSKQQFIAVMNNLNLSYPKKMIASVSANKYCGDFIPSDIPIDDTQSLIDEEKRQIELTVSTNNEIYNDYYAMYI